MYPSTAHVELVVWKREDLTGRYIRIALNRMRSTISRSNGHLEITTNDGCSFQIVGPDWRQETDVHLNFARDIHDEGRALGGILEACLCNVLRKLVVHFWLTHPCVRFAVDSY